MTIGFYRREYTRRRRTQRIIKAHVLLCFIRHDISTPLTPTNKPPLYWTLTLATSLACILFV